MYLQQPQVNSIPVTTTGEDFVHASATTTGEQYVYVLATTTGEQ